MSLRDTILIGGVNYTRTAAHMIRNGYDREEVLAALDEIMDTDERMIEVTKKFTGRIKVMSSSCWIWIGRYNKQAPVFGHKHRLPAAILFEMVSGYQVKRVRRLCDTKTCVNPAHHKEVALKEKSITARILRTINKYGKFIKVHGSSYMVAGTPDIFGSINGRSVLIEVKNETGKLRPAQVIQISEWRERGDAIVIVARSLEDVIDGLASAGIKIPTN